MDNASRAWRRFTLVRGSSDIEQEDVHLWTSRPRLQTRTASPIDDRQQTTHRLTTAQHLAMLVSTNGNLATCAAAGARPPAR